MYQRETETLTGGEEMEISVLESQTHDQGKGKEGRKKASKNKCMDALSSVSSE